MANRQPPSEILTEREQKILILLADGLSNQEIANRLYLAEKTVRWHNTQIFRKLGISTRREAHEKARILGLLASSHRHNLPAQATAFVGRQHELHKIAALLDDAKMRLITLLAPGGMGKTRLALEIARSQVGRYADGVYFVSLAPLSATREIVTAIAENIGFSFYGEKSPAQQLADFLADREMLLVLDNFEHLLDGAALVSDFLQAAPRLRILTTSREHLGLYGETVYALRGLEFPTAEAALECDSVKLFLQSARRVRPDFEVHDLEHLALICRLTEGMPLGIELAAGWVDVLTLEQIALEIQRGIDILETDMRHVPERHRSLRATFERTWERLSAEEQRMFMRVSVFRGGFTAEAAQAVAEADIRSLRRLSNKALLQTTLDHRHDIHELLRQFGAEKLAASGERSRIEAVHAAFFADFMAERKQDMKSDRQLEASNLVEADFENIRVAWLHTIDERAWEVLPKFLHSLWYYLYVKMRRQEGIELFEFAAKAIRSMPTSKITELALGSVLARLGPFYFDMSLYEKAADTNNEAIRLLRPLDSPDDLMASIHARQNVYKPEQLEVAFNLSQEGLNVARATGDKYWEAHFLINTALLHDVQGSYVSGLGFAEEALLLFEALGDRYGLLLVYLALGRIRLHQKEYDQARHWFLQEQPLAEAFGNVWNLARLHDYLSEIAFHSGDHVAARMELTLALSFLWNGGYERIIPLMLTRFARMFAAQNNLEKAVEILGTAQKYPLEFVKTNQIIQTMREELQAKMDAEIFEAAWGRGQEKTMSILVAELLA